MKGNAESDKNKQHLKKAVNPLYLLLVISVIVIFVFAPWSTAKSTDDKYQSAIEFYKCGEYSKALELFVSLQDDTERMISLTRLQQIRAAQKGDIVIFGNYEQDNDLSDGMEEIEWLVLDRQGDKILLISRYALDMVQYNWYKSNVTWESCSLRDWLNSEFFIKAFSESQRDAICLRTVSADRNPKYMTDPGNDTEDRIFLLSIEEATEYFTSKEARMCEPTDYAVARGAFVFDRTGTCLWWLRTPGVMPYFASGVLTDGGISLDGGAVNYLGFHVDRTDECIRPVIWLDTEAYSVCMQTE